MALCITSLELARFQYPAYQFGATGSSRFFSDPKFIIDSQDPILGLAKEYTQTKDAKILEQLLEKLDPYIRDQAKFTHFRNRRFTIDEIVADGKELVYKLLEEEKLRPADFTDEKAFIAYIKRAINSYFTYQTRQGVKFQTQGVTGEEAPFRSSTTRFGKLDEELEERKRALEILAHSSGQEPSLLQTILSIPVTPKYPSYTEFDLLRDTYGIPNGIADDSTSANKAKGPNQREISRRLGVHEGTVSRSLSLALKKTRLALGIIAERGTLNQADIKFLQGFTKKK